MENPLMGACGWVAVVYRGDANKILSAQSSGAMLKRSTSTVFVTLKYNGKYIPYKK